MRPANPELALASRKVRVGHIAQLPDGTRWLRVDARKDCVSSEGTCFAYEHACSRCGLTRREIRYGSRRNCDEPEVSIEYGPAEGLL